MPSGRHVTPPVTPYSGGTRALDGVTVFASTDEGERAVFMRACMPIRGALLSVARELDARGGRWYVDVISSPTAIWNDMRGRQQVHRQNGSPYVVTPERQLLGRIGRLDLLRA